MLILGYNTDFTLQDNIQTINYSGDGIMILMGTLSVGVHRLIFLTLLPHNTFDKAYFPLPCLCYMTT